MGSLWSIWAIRLEGVTEGNEVMEELQKHLGRLELCLDNITIVTVIIRLDMDKWTVLP